VLILNGYWNLKTNRVKLLLVKSYSVEGLRNIAQKRKCHVIGENLIMPACKITVGKILGQDAVQEMENVQTAQ
jgi:hypothetical protein